MKGDWNFCPVCGARRNADPMDALGRDLFSDIFEKMKAPLMEEMDRMSDKKIEVVDLSPIFRKIQEEKKGADARGFRINITTGTGMKPNINIQTFGGVDRGRLEKELGKFVPVRDNPQEPQRRSIQQPRISAGSVKITAEPKAEIRRMGDSVVVDINMPGVRSDDDIEIRELESSVEVKAIAGDTAYFKILTKPGQFSISRKNFQNGTLHLEFS
jgi:HSP20 family molecular chaperone IbpA